MREQINEIVSQHPREQGSLIPVLQQVQEKFGYLPAEAMKEVTIVYRRTRAEMPASAEEVEEAI